MSKPTKKRWNKFPKGWDEKRVRRLIDHYDKQADRKAAAEDDAAWRDPKVTMMAVPVELVPRVQKLIARNAG